MGHSSCLSRNTERQTKQTKASDSLSPVSMQLARRSTPFWRGGARTSLAEADGPAHRNRCCSGDLTEMRVKGANAPLVSWATCWRNTVSSAGAAVTTSMVTPASRAAKAQLSNGTYAPSVPAPGATTRIRLLAPGTSRRCRMHTRAARDNAEGRPERDVPAPAATGAPCSPSSSTCPGVEPVEEASAPASAAPTTSMPRRRLQNPATAACGSAAPCAELNASPGAGSSCSLHPLPNPTTPMRFAGEKATWEAANPAIAWKSRPSLCAPLASPEAPSAPRADTHASFSADKTKISISPSGPPLGAAAIAAAAMLESLAGKP
mmetsp:Transcript_20622/g.79155  ORF Transcript_20622/g.79155 Transcript_20622/m.79155 type:complete len:320 (-) Transcript_20622:343-1302(-)